MSQEPLNPISPLALHVFRAHQSLSGVGDALTAPWGMTSAKWKVLGAVELSDAPPTATGIGRIMGLTRQAATKQIGMLVNHGLLAPHDNPLDARAAVYTLSPEGKAAYLAISSAWASHVEVMRASIGDKEIASALKVLEQLVLQLEKVQGSTTPTPRLSQTEGITKMKSRAHAVFGSIALLCIFSFWTSTLVSELFLSQAAIVAVKGTILQAMWILIPAII